MALDNYKRSRQAHRKKARTAPPTPEPKPGGWHPTKTTFNTHPINPDLDITPQQNIIVCTHPIDNTQAIVYKRDGTVLSILAKSKVDQLHNLHQPQHTTTFEEDLTALILRSNTQGHKQKILRELKLSKIPPPAQHQALSGRWPFPDEIYTALDSLFHIDRVLHCSPMNLPTAAKEYYTKDEFDACFSAGLQTDTPWTGISLSLPEHSAQCLTHSLEHALYSAHYHRKIHLLAQSSSYQHGNTHLT